MFISLRKMIEKLQIRILFNFPLLRVLIAKIALSGFKYNLPMYLVTVFLGVFLLPIAILHSTINTLCGKFVIGQISTIITTMCNLKCVQCLSMMPLYRHPLNMDLVSVLNDIDKLLEIVDYIYAFQISGGEPFLNKDIAVIIKRLLSSNKIATINIVTNGGVIPEKETLNAMKDKKVKVQISGYPQDLVPNISEFMKTLDNNNIKYAYSVNQKWKYLGDKSYKHREPVQRKEVFDLCVFTMCNHMINGKYHICSFSANGMNLGIIPQDSSDYVDIRELPILEARKELRCLLNKKYITACNYCEGNTFLSKTIPSAEQIKSVSNDINCLESLCNNKFIKNDEANNDKSSN
jgi:organic radical activating enzyme